MADFIKFSREVDFVDVEEELGIISSDRMKSYIKIIEKNHGLQGYFTEADSYLTKDLVEETILDMIKDQDMVGVAAIQESIKLKLEIVIDVLKSFLEKGMISGSLNANKSRLYSFSKIKNTFFNPLLEAKEIQLEELNAELQLSEAHLVSNVEKLLDTYQKQLRGFLTIDKKTFIKEETMTYRLMDVLNAEDRISLKELEELTHVGVEILERLITNALEIGLISGKLTKDVFIKG